MNKVVDYLLNRIGEASTWRGIVALLTLVGVQISPEQSGAIITAGLSIYSAILVFKKDASSPDSEVK